MAVALLSFLLHGASDIVHTQARCDVRLWVRAHYGVMLRLLPLVAVASSCEPSPSVWGGSWCDLRSALRSALRVAGLALHG